jgi:hypothetical protein
MKLNKELIEIGKEVLKKEDRVILASAIGVHISTIYPILRGVFDVSRRQYDTLQEYIRKAKKERL